MPEPSKALPISFVILAPEHNIARIKLTAKSIAVNCNSPYICVVGDNTSKEELEEIKKICPCYKGKSTITSLINVGFSKSKSWNALIMEGVWIKPTLEKKYSSFIKNENEIIYPLTIDYDRNGKVIQTHSTFYDCSLNGIMIHHKTFNKVGKFSETHNLEDARILWGAEALTRKMQLKGMTGLRIF